MKENKPSFAMEAKEEIAQIEFPPSCQASFLSAFARINGSIRLSAMGEELDLSSESAKIAKALYLMASSLLGRQPRFSYSRGIGFRKKMKYHVLVPEAPAVLERLEVDYFSPRIPHGLVDSDEEASAYLSGAFLASGSVNDPSSSNYHLEIATNDQSYAKWLCHLLTKAQGHHFSPKVSARRNQWIVYLKKAEQISEFLVLVGATSACLKFEDVRVNRDFANIGNRLTNLDTANMSKTMEAGARQKKEIEFLLSHFPETHWNPKERALMELRVANPEASLGELAVALSEELASTISKSNVNHIFRSIHEAYLKEHPSEKE